ncbi:hypothetical protein BSKO_11291 [Bryopsis sp. KO-2023]|nr:hypothetical protein BSKO_11291 [Bryopsis sp. KO-2023]
MAAVIQSCWRGAVTRAKYRDKIVKAIKAARDYAAQEQLQPSKIKSLVDKMRPSDAGLHRRQSGKWANVLRHAGKFNEAPSGSSSSVASDWSDLDLEELEVLKYRSGTPPWQRQEDARWSGVQAKMSYQPVRGNLDVLWDQVDCQERIGKVIERRKERDPQDDPVEEEFDPSLPPELINDMLLDRYLEKYERMGLTVGVSYDKF